MNARSRAVRLFMFLVPTIVVASVVLVSRMLTPAEAQATPLACITILGNDADNTLTGGSGCDIIWGYGGNDGISGNGGNDQLHAGSGNDMTGGDADADEIWGGAGNDELYGGVGPDVTHDDEYNDNDVHCGGDGNDSIVLGDGDTSDFGWGEAGTDTYNGIDDGECWNANGTCGIT